MPHQRHDALVDTLLELEPGEMVCASPLDKGLDAHVLMVGDASTSADAHLD
ncbi:MAG: hypothetical protein M3485_07015 [Pseudomonadota bacterium]|nr:hypothetical protein [Pseudomonadota bacterium]